MAQPAADRSLVRPVLAGVITAAIVGGAAFLYEEITRSEAHRGGWWPPRLEYRCDLDNHCLSADHVVFNSIINLPSYGDERAFVDARLADSERDKNVNVLRVSPGDTVVVRAYVDNNANPNRADTGRGMALDTKVRFVIPDEVKSDQLVTGVISADNANPRAVGDTARLIGDGSFSLSYVEGSARLFNNVFKDGFELEEAVISDGAEIGVEEAGGRFCCQLDGRYPPCDPTLRGCEVFDSLVEIKLRVNAPDVPSGIVEPAYAPQGGSPESTAST